MVRPQDAARLIHKNRPAPPARASNTTISTTMSTKSSPATLTASDDPRSRERRIAASAARETAPGEIMRTEMTGPARFDPIRTDRLLMRRWVESDREPFAALNGDPQTMRFFPGTLDPAASDALADHIESLFEKQGYGLWALEVQETGEFIGFTGLNPMPAGVPGAGGVEIGWRLGGPASA